MGFTEISIFAPSEYIELPQEVKDSYGCGPGGFGDFLVPDTIWFLKVKVCCSIHDFYYRYYAENSEAGRKEADDIFLNNMVRVINAKTKWLWLKKLRLRRAKTYYYMVRRYGGPSFWDSRNKTEEILKV
jgi:hypothetical protein